MSLLNFHTLPESHAALDDVGLGLGLGGVPHGRISAHAAVAVDHDRIAVRLALSSAAHDLCLCVGTMVSTGCASSILSGLTLVCALDRTLFGVSGNANRIDVTHCGSGSAGPQAAKQEMSPQVKSSMIVLGDSSDTML